ncbi:1-deoxy-D-xylulose-5-phosphate synthase N-terminal domain-containing protein [Streptomyces sp. NBC_01317]|uniref:1-deoxy-D-xylulose-5-phosphate synthase N-terminal domain-containing protein n=1 Tax=Streptomyces sp. NBC_01317 TaxID=2903822 RepID=UPI003FA39CEC
MSILEGIRGPHDLKALTAGQLGEKLLTGRQDFSELRGKGGLSGYPSRAESDHDVIENSHASTVLGWADGPAQARDVLRHDHHVVGMDVLPRAHDAEVLVVSVGALAPCLAAADLLAERGIPCTVVDPRWVKPVDVPLRGIGIPEQFLPHAKRSEVLADLGRTPVEIAGRISAALAHKENSE